MPPIARVRLPAARACAALLLATGLAACAEAPSAAPPPRVSTWRIVVFGADDATDAASGTAIGNELLHRGIATGIVTAEGPVDHILTVSIQSGATHARVHRPRRAKPGATTPLVPATPIAAQETVSNGRDPNLAVQRVFDTGGPAPGEPPEIAADAVRSLAWQIGQTLSSAPVEPISVPGAGMAPSAAK